MGESYQTVPNVNDLVDGHPKELRLMLDESDAPARESRWLVSAAAAATP